MCITKDKEIVRKVLTVVIWFLKCNVSPSVFWISRGEFLCYFLFLFMFHVLSSYIFCFCFVKCCLGVLWKANVKHCHINFCSILIQRYIVCSIQVTLCLTFLNCNVGGYLMIWGWDRWKFFFGSNFRWKKFLGSKAKEKQIGRFISCAEFYSNSTDLQHYSKTKKTFLGMLSTDAEIIRYWGLNMETRILKIT